MCLNETLLNDICFDHKLFPNSLTAVLSDKVSRNKSNTAVLRAVPSAVGTYKRRYDLQFYDEWSGWKFSPKVAAVY
jgi:hypothetical protein